MRPNQIWLTPWLLALSGVLWADERSELPPGFGLIPATAEAPEAEFSVAATDGPPPLRPGEQLVSDQPISEFAALQERLDQLEADFKKQRATEKKKADADAKRPTVRWTGQLQVDNYWFSQSPENKTQYGNIENGSAFRRARIGMFGEHGPADYRIEVDFALVGRPSFLDVFAGLNDLPLLGRVRVGHFFEPFSLERITPNRFVTFMERSLPDQAFAPARNTGIMAHDTLLDERIEWSLGLFRTNSDVWGDDFGDEFESAVTGRLTGLPWYSSDGTRYMHLGSAYSFRGPDRDTVRFASQPEARLGATLAVPFFADTGRIPVENYHLLGWEAAIVHGPWSVQSEYVYVPVDSTQAGMLHFDAWYVTTSLFLTGEHRPYRKDTGTFDRVTPKADFVRDLGSRDEGRLAFGPGAWEIAARVSQLDLNDEFVQGGYLTDFTIGLNWYLSPYLRWTSNYVHSISRSFEFDDSTADIFGTRIGFDF
jgi:phosphate-selective porin OprO/OprP